LGVGLRPLGFGSDLLDASPGGLHLQTTHLVSHWPEQAGRLITIHELRLDLLEQLQTVLLLANERLTLLGRSIDNRLDDPLGLLQFSLTPGALALVQESSSRLANVLGFGLRALDHSHRTLPGKGLRPVNGWHVEARLGISIDDARVKLCGPSKLVLTLLDEDGLLLRCGCCDGRHDIHSLGPLLLLLLLECLPRKKDSRPPLVIHADTTRP